MAAPIGKNLLAKMVPTMCEEVGKKTNHSLRVAGASSLFAAGIPERVIQQRTGHRSLDGLRTYKRVTEDQNVEVSKILSGQDPCASTSKAFTKPTDLSAKQSQPSPVNPFGVQYNN